ncbi:MAG: aminotransferase class V-fold PLP-dependent enzyme [Deltaproteobacteria bacterium]
MNRDELNGKPLASYREEFSITEKRLYLDHAGVAPLPSRVKRAVEGFIESASDDAMFAYDTWTAKVEEVRGAAARLINAEPQDVAFLKNTSHGLSIIAEGLDWREGDNVIIAERDFPSNLYPWLHLKRKGVEARSVKPRGVEICVEDVAALMDERTRVVSISSVQFWSGYRVNLKKLGALCRERGALFCLDAIQSLGVVPTDVRDLGVDVLSADGHKWLLAPEGTAIFYCKRELAERVPPMLVGWKSIQNELDYDNFDFSLKPSALKYEEGSLNVMGIYALGAALELLAEVGADRVYAGVIELGGVIMDEAEKRGFHVRTPRNPDERAGIISFTGEFDPLLLKETLKERGIMINVRGGGVRVSPHFYNDERDIERLFDGIDESLKSLAMR